MELLGSAVITLGAAELDSALDYPTLVARIGRSFTDPIRCPRRLVVERAEAGEAPATLLVMAAARDGGAALVKSVTVGASEALRSQVLLLGADGRLLALIDGESLTARRTAAASVCAAALLARPDAAVLAVLGAGPQAAALARAYAACRPLERILVWARRADRAASFADGLARHSGVLVEVAASAADAVRSADIVTCATRAEAPLVRSADVRPGTHIDLVGGFRPAMREADDALMVRARVVADTAQALVEAGDLCGPLVAGLIRPADVALLGDLLRGGGPTRGADEVTLYKSVGFAALDLVAAELALELLGGG